MGLDALDFVAGCFGGAAGVLAGHPMDTVKVRLQTQHSHGATPLYRGTFHCFGLIVKKEGFTGLYKGLTSPLASLCLINATAFGVQAAVTKEFRDPQSLGAQFWGGCAAGATQSIIAAPSERVKLKMQLQSDSRAAVYKSPMHAARVLVAEKGLLSMNRGFMMTVVRDCPAWGVYFASYDLLARGMSKDGTMESLTAPQVLTAGGLAGMLSWLPNYPADVIKTRFQADDSYRTYWECIKKTYHERGVRGFYAGLGSTMLRAFPSNAATFFTVEWTYRLLLDFNILGVGAPAEKMVARHVHIADLWTKNHFELPEAGSTSLDPMLHSCRYF
ncbi:unnamed protein product, partial [Mesorhabditis belari]|uniref:Mitochondrial basic amino acids transporter n=1 Tax=Mesorhabditis belari TaxID=2138241 RepID=A0AAF3FDS7_9BILA